MIKLRLATFYAADHRRLDEGLSAFRRLKQKDPPKAKEALRNFRSGLEQHMAWEEAILFPEYDARIPHAEGNSTQQLLSEHAEILNLLDRIEEKLTDPDFDSDTLEAQLVKVLAAHNQTEEQGLYSELDKRLNEGERRTIFSHMKEAAWESSSIKAIDDEGGDL